MNSISPLLTSSACAGLFEVCLFLPDESSSDISPPQLCFLLLGPASPNWTSVPIWSPGCCSCRLTFTNSRDTQAAKTTVMIFVNTLISQPFALHVVSVTLYLFLSSPYLTARSSSAATGRLISKSNRQQGARVEQHTEAV